MERTLVLVKPDGVNRKLTGRIIAMYEQRNLSITAIKMLIPTAQIAEAHYEEHKDKSFFRDLIDYLTSGQVCAMILEGEKAVEKVRKINGKTDPMEAELSSVRGMYAISKSQNTVHSSDSIQSAEREIKIWFPEFK